MKIQVLGSGCPTCQQLFMTTKQVIKDLKIDTEVEYVTDIAKIVVMGIMQSPVLVMDNKAVLIGGGKSKTEIKDAICKNIKTTNYNGKPVNHDGGL